MGYVEHVGNKLAEAVILFGIICLATVVITSVVLYVELSKYDENWDRIDGGDVEREVVEWEDMSDKQKRDELLSIGYSDCRIDAIIEFDIENYPIFTEEELGC